MKFLIDQSSAGERIDSFLSRQLLDYSRNHLSQIIKNGNVTINNFTVKPSYKLKNGDFVEIIDLENDKIDLKVEAEQISLNIIYEDENIIVINKQPGIVVHPGVGNRSGTLVNALLNHFPKIREAVFEKGNKLSESRPGLVHRLDKDTSGVILIAKNARSLHSLAKQIQNRTVRKFYLALCYGWPKNDSGVLVNFLGRSPKNRKAMTEVGREKGKEAISIYNVKEYLKDQSGNKLSLIEFEIKTGRTHQIRVQSKIINHPVLGDMLYGSKENLELSQKLKVNRQLLHAEKIIVHLLDKKDAVEFCAPIANDFDTVLLNLKKS